MGQGARRWIYLSPLSFIAAFLTATVANSQSADTSLAEAFRKQVTPCWYFLVPPEGKVPSVVVLNVHMNRNGELVGPPTLASKLDTADPYVQAEIRNAMHAVFACAPYKMPPEQFETWKDAAIAFDPGSLARTP